MEQWFEGKVALVTGGGDGIGRAAALLFARRGASVCVTDIRRDTAEATAAMIVGEGGTAVAADGDVTEDRTVAVFVDRTVEAFGRLDCAFNNAGISLPDDHFWGEECTRRIFDVNVMGVMRCIRYEVPVMLQTGGGTIVNTASLSGFIASRSVFMPAYTASKHAVIGATKSAALQYARDNIRVNALCPGTTATAMVRQVGSASPEIRALLDDRSPMGRMGTAEEMAEAAIWLCSNKSSYINGHALIVDGGAAVE